jgi:hypothetical protein
MKNFCSVGNGTEKDDCFFALSGAEGVIPGKILYTADNYFYFPRNGHPDDSFPEKIPGHVIINHNNARRLDEGHPRLQYLAVNKPVIHPHKRYIHRHRQRLKQ